MTRARYPDQEGRARNGDVELHYEVYGDGEITVFLLPAWQIVHSRAWKAQVPFFSRHYRVLTYDARGNGKSDRPSGPNQYSYDHLIADAWAAMDASRTERAVVMGCSMAGHLAALLAAERPERIAGAVLIAPSSPFGPSHEFRNVDFEERREAYDGWHRYNTNYVRQDFRGFAEWFGGNCVNEPHSTKAVEDIAGWTLETTAATLIDTMRAPDAGAGDEETFRRIRCPVLFLHGENDLIQPVAKTRYLAALCNGRVRILPGSGHVPQARIPAKVNLMLKDFVDEIAEGDRAAHGGTARRPGDNDRSKVMTRARYPDQEGQARNGDVGLHYEVYGAGETTVLLLPTWQIVHSRKWKGQIATLARHYRVVTFDGRGSGKSGRPVGAEHYGWDHYVNDAIAVMDATKTNRAVVIGNSLGGEVAPLLAHRCPERVRGLVLIGPSASIGPQCVKWNYDAFLSEREKFERYDKWNAAYWRRHYRDFSEEFLGSCFSESHSTKQIEDAVSWSEETTPETLIDTMLGDGTTSGADEEVYRRLSCPVLLIHGTADEIEPIERSRLIAELCGGKLVELAGSGHVPEGRIPAKVNLLIMDFIDGLTGAAATPPPRAQPPRRAAKRALYLSSPIGLGHGRRDLAITRELRQLHPGLEVDWLAQDPVTKLLEAAGERIHPASRLLANESAHIEAEADGHDLHVFEAMRRMDEILIANFMLFQEIVRDDDYDLILADEAWDVDYFWHEHPELKRAPLAWFTDFVGFLPMPDKGERDAFLTADYNAEMIEHIEASPALRDLAIFVGNPEDCVDTSMGPNLPGIREWTEKHFRFSGYITGFDPADFGPKEALRAALGYRPDERVCIVTVGGSGVGRPLLQRVLAAYPLVKRRLPELRMIAVAGPRIDPASLDASAGVEVRPFVPDLPRHLAAADLAIVQGGLTTCMELTASGTPFIYVPLRNHFEQNFHVRHRLERYNAGRRMSYEETDPDSLAAAMVELLGTNQAFRPVETDGAAKAAAMIAGLL
jgi:pimeloyl-ACP methyl ester carboxylesterase/predicted glycosyltransferase